MKLVKNILIALAMLGGFALFIWAAYYTGWPTTPEACDHEPRLICERVSVDGIRATLTVSYEMYLTQAAATATAQPKIWEDGYTTVKRFYDPETKKYIYVCEVRNKPAPCDDYPIED